MIIEVSVKTRAFELGPSTQGHYTLKTAGYHRAFIIKMRKVIIGRWSVLFCLIGRLKSSS